MHGKPLDKVWMCLTQEHRTSICRQIAGYLEELQQLTGKQIEAINGPPVRVGGYYSRRSGPFESENDFNHFMAPDAQEYPSHDHAIHFAHGDSSPRNMLVDETSQITAALDWEWAGWFPEYCDVVRMFVDTPSKK
ncbi:hypothetical protein EMPG_16092 [Blastomyces silverae]|uniref:Aminoglycoside phosphotransferase domain-containing protein n=1 Tax=Blastomyces silverae TaxID=2060906 RepID=A0A0H1BBU6_9EURO|nr:hypothetical protein EMPG_16092 [Blastomyces silverae]